MVPVIAIATAHVLHTPAPPLHNPPGVPQTERAGVPHPMRPVARKCERWRRTLALDRGPAASIRVLSWREPPVWRRSCLLSFLAQGPPFPERLVWYSGKIPHGGPPAQHS